MLCKKLHHAAFRCKDARQTVVSNQPGVGPVYGPELVYCTRLDSLPNGDAMINAPLVDLMRVYYKLLAAGKLPPRDTGMKPQGAPKPPGVETSE